MKDFIEWAFDLHTPAWVSVIVMVALASFGVFAFVLSIAALVAGYWIVPLLIWVVFPAYLVILEYKRSGGKK